MHLYEPAVGFLGTNGVVAPGIPIAAGAALSAKLRKTGQVVVCFFGDGAVNNGAFHEGVNMAAVWNLPVLFICEITYMRRRCRPKGDEETSIAGRGAIYNIPELRLTGMMFWQYTKKRESD